MPNGRWRKSIYFIFNAVLCRYKVFPSKKTLGLPFGRELTKGRLVRHTGAGTSVENRAKDYQQQRTPGARSGWCFAVVFFWDEAKVEGHPFPGDQIRIMVEGEGV